MTLHKKQHLHPHNSIIINTTSTPQTYVEISKSAFDHNITYYKNLIGPHNKLAIVIKGNGYGHGSDQIAYLCERNSLVDWLCVAQLSEGIALRNITKPILVLGYSDISPESAIHKNIFFMVDNLEYAYKLNEIGKKHTYRFNIHVKIDTGLSRMGVLVAEAIPFKIERFLNGLGSMRGERNAGAFEHKHHA